MTAKHPFTQINPILTVHGRVERGFLSRHKHRVIDHLPLDLHILSGLLNRVHFDIQHGVCTLIDAQLVGGVLVVACTPPREGVFLPPEDGRRGGLDVDKHRAVMGKLNDVVRLAHLLDLATDRLASYELV